jgi:hypothetical protein
MYMLRIGRDSDVDVELTPSKRYIITDKAGTTTQCENIGAVTYLTNAMRSGVKVPNKWFIDFQNHVIGELVEKLEEVTNNNAAS